MTRSIRAECGSGTTEKSRSWTLGAMWMRELTKSLTDAEREALARALALLLDRSAVA